MRSSVLVFHEVTNGPFETCENALGAVGRRWATGATTTRSANSSAASPDPSILSRRTFHERQLLFARGLSLVRQSRSAAGAGAGGHAVGRRFHCGRPRPAAATGLPSSRLRLCGQCGNVQLGHVVNPEIVYRKYRYTTSVSLGLTDHFPRYADLLLARVNVRPGALVVELGSNKGAMLRAFKRRGVRAVGVDPAREIAARATAAGIETVPDYFTAELAGALREQHGPTSLIIANNVFANIDDLGDVVRGVRTLLAPDGVFVAETSYCLDVVEKALLDTIFHEHLTYFAATPLAAFFAQNGMQLIDAEHVETKGGSLRATAQLAGGPRPVAPAVGEAIRREAEAGLARPETYQRLAVRIARQKADLRKTLAPSKSAGKVVAGYGARWARPPWSIISAWEIFSASSLMMIRGSATPSVPGSTCRRFHHRLCTIARRTARSCLRGVTSTRS